MKSFKQLFSILLTLFVFNNTIEAQTCESFILFKKGATYELETYNDKGKKESRMACIVKEVNTSTDKLESVIQSTTYNETDKNSTPQTVNLKTICQGDKLFFDLTESLKSMQNSDATKDMEIIIDGAMIEIPKQLSVGKMLPDMATKVKMMDKKSSTEMMAIDITTINRKVVSSEKVTTPAGTFDCFKIYQEQIIAPKMVMMNMSLPKTTMISYIYFSTKEIGMVKTEIMDKKGTEVKSYTIVTKYSK